MQVLSHFLMENHTNAQHLYKDKKLDKNGIKDKGCEFLAQSKWITLEEIVIGIRNKTQLVTKLALKELDIWCWLHGKISKNLTSVIKV